MIEDSKSGLHKKRGQATIFVLIGLVILSSIAITLYLNYDVIKDKLSINPKDFTITIDQVRNTVEKCLKETTENGIFSIGLQGGYYDTKAPFEQLSDIQVPYYFHLGNENIPTKKTIQDELSRYVKENLQRCIGLTPFENQGYNFELGEISATITIKEGRINADAEYPITVQKESITSTIKSFNQQILFDFNAIYNLITSLANEQKKHPDSMPLIFLSNMAYDNGFKYVTTDVGENTVLFTLFFNNSLRDDYYIHAFMAKYKQTEVYIPQETEPVAAKRGEYKTKLFAASNEASNQYFAAMSDTEFGDYLKESSTSLQKNEVFDEFNKRIKTGGETGILSVLNNNEEVRDEWFSKFGITCEECKLTSFDGKTAVTAFEKVSFNPSELKGSSIFKNGTILLDNGLRLSEGATVTKIDTSYAIKGGKTNFISLRNFKPAKIIKGKALITANDESNYYIEATSDKPMIVSFDEDYSSPTISGSDILVSAHTDKGAADDKTFLKFSGKMMFTIKGKYRLVDGAQVTDYRNGKPSAEFKLTKETDYFQTKNQCSLNYPRSCIEKDGNELKVIAKDDNSIQIRILDNSVSEFKHSAIRDRSTIVFNNKDLLELKFGKKDMPQITKGDSMASDVHFQRILNEIVTLDYRPAEGGYAVDILVNGNPVGAMMSRELLTMNSVQDSIKNQKGWVEKIKSDFGGQSPHTILGYLNSPDELPFIQAIYNAQDKTKMDANFLSSVAFGEGLIFWMDDIYYESPNYEVDALGGIGADRFGKEVKSYEQSLKTSNVDLKGKKLTAKITGITELGLPLQNIKPTEIEIDADKVTKVDGKTILEVRGDIVEIEGDKINIKAKGLIEKGYLREDFKEFKLIGQTAVMEKGETVPRLTFNNINSGLEGMGAMLRARRELFLNDVQKAGFNPKKLSEDQIDFWTYVYYNGGSGAPEDIFGVGRRIVTNRLNRQGLKGLDIPTGQTEIVLFSNAQRILGTKKLLDKANPSLVKSASLALK